ncbi:hypothetical protein SBA_pBAR1_680 (plasmid) [Sphingomonas bisphenolicum]|uniref:Uncharacterized protein n=1 Tax=Sphingomonas bisphenolicum TaxID=296544 RepID=A0ABM7GAT0_9SPHN|nr:hypothetical protein SBA_pBAR1_680 [Sphingomonas bisphenolicum]
MHHRRRYDQKGWRYKTQHLAIGTHTPSTGPDQENMAKLGVSMWLDRPLTWPGSIV